MTNLPPRAWANLLAYGASPPEYPGLVLVPKEVLDELREWNEGERVNVAATGQSLSNGETWEDGWERGWRAGANAIEAGDKAEAPPKPKRERIDWSNVVVDEGDESP